MLDVKIKKLNNLARIPKLGSEKAAGVDLYAATDYNIHIEPHKTVMVGTGLSITPPDGYFGAIVARSGLAAKRGLAPANKLGVCDEDYTGEYIVALHNHSDEEQIVEAGERIAQLIFLPYIIPNFIEVDELEKTERGDGGFGHSGSK